ncbi:MAG: 2-succinyl-5-enolpyruvyl-6-hydroxy-3-cyclohexene-1-carboxylic-acid synthase [Actinomycetota bacterium]|nr:2-succinyl-5-enolpyruvyl-6-hydroxy-3-cyclohexene-1-carboxylic-acid synthase [Actinomycetota bacterium]
MNASTAQAIVMVDELVRCGVTDAVVCPGSRSTPLALAIAEAEKRGVLTLHVRLDERTAGYLAVGLAKVTGIPAVVVTTSGTAAVNLHPAIVEADQCGIPLIALTADRPPQLRGVGANQTIRQPTVFGSDVRLAVDMAAATDQPGQVRYWRSTVARVVAAATDAIRPGPVHVNAAFTEPLVPGEDQGWIEELDGRPDGRPWTADARLVAGMSTPLDDVLADLLDDEEVPTRGLVVIGDHDDQEAVELVDELADTLGWPVIAEPSGNGAGCTTALSHGPLLLADAAFADAHVPEIVITVGRVGLNRSVLALVARAGLHVAVDARPEWSDPTRTADVVVATVPLPPTEGEVDEGWLASWQRADVLAAAAVETALFSADGVLTGMHVARVTASAVPDGGLLFIGASWPVRHVGSFAANTVQDAVILGNRGTSGIDGCVSTAWGAAAALQRNGGAGAMALVGDHTFLYDSNGLLAPAEEERPDLVIVVSDNDGGGIFSSLEQGAERHAEHFERVFGVPLGIDIPALCKSMGIPATLVTSASALAEAIDDAVGTGGVRVVVAQTCSREHEAAVLVNVQRAVSEALGSA